MIYTASITTAKNTAKQDAKETRLSITNGVITQVMVLFPAGCAGLVNVQFFIGGHQFAPSTEGQVFKGDNVLIASPEFLHILDAPRLVRILTWNNDQTYGHTVEVMLTQLPEEAIPQLGFVKGIVQSLKSMFIREAREN